MLRNSVLDDEKFSEAVSSKSDVGKLVFQFLLWAILWFVLLALSQLAYVSASSSELIKDLTGNLYCLLFL